MKKRVQVDQRVEAVADSVETITEVSKVSVSMVAIFATIVGLWSLACIIGGIVAGGGIGGLLSGWFSAVTGGGM